MATPWPAIPYDPWRDTCEALHLFTQIVGKYRLARTPWVNHSWHVTLYVNARGFTTGLVPDGAGTEIAFDLIDHELVGTSADGRVARMPLRPGTVASFHAGFVDMLRRIGGLTEFGGRPNEVADPIPFSEDHRPRPYDRDAVARFFQACLRVDRAFHLFRTSFLGKVSPVHLFWGSFDLAVTRFSGQGAPRHPGGIPALPDDVTCEAYSHQVSSAGFWPGGSGVEFPAFYSYAYPAPDGFAAARVAPAEAYFDTKLGEFILPYDAVREAADPEAALRAFLQSTYAAAADLGGWPRHALECETGAPGRPRKV